jgi:hypothetical protein
VRLGSRLVRGRFKTCENTKRDEADRVSRKAGGIVRALLSPIIALEKTH